ncbi:hypothetical protein JOQ06_006085, partial [Pogonophryne albipinna]
KEESCEPFLRGETRCDGRGLVSVLTCATCTEVSLAVTPLPSPSPMDPIDWEVSLCVATPETEEGEDAGSQGRETRTGRGWEKKRAFPGMGPPALPPLLGDYAGTQSGAGRRAGAPGDPTVRRVSSVESGAGVCARGLPYCTSIPPDLPTMASLMALRIPPYPLLLLYQLLPYEVSEESADFSKFSAQGEKGNRRTGRTEKDRLLGQPVLLKCWQNPGLAWVSACILPSESSAGHTDVLIITRRQQQLCVERWENRGLASCGSQSLCPTGSRSLNWRAVVVPCDTDKVCDQNDDPEDEPTFLRSTLPLSPISTMQTPSHHLAKGLLCALAAGSSGVAGQLSGQHNYPLFSLTPAECFCVQ